jgi:CheY-like chemotaxis protein
MALKVLIVDDDPDSASYLRDILEDHGFSAVSAHDGEEGLEVSRRERPDLILLDLMMPRKTGIRMFQELKKDPELREIPVVVVTGISQATGVDFRDFLFKQPDKEKAVGTHGLTQYTAPDGYVEKPIDPDELMRVVRKALQEKA